jgi:hypothetical protein
LIPVLHGKVLNQVRSKSGLAKMDGDRRRRNMPQEVDTKKPIHYPCEVNFAPFGQQITEERFNIRIL